MPDSVSVDVTVTLTPTDRVLAAARSIRELGTMLRETFDLDERQLTKIAELALSGQTTLTSSMEESREQRQHAACLSIAEGREGWDVSSFDDSPAMLAVRSLQHRVSGLLDTGREQSKRFEDERDEARRQVHELEPEKRDLESRIGFLEEQARRVMMIATPGASGLVPLADDGATVKAVLELRHSRDRLVDESPVRQAAVDQRLEQLRQERDDARRQLDTIKGVAEGVPGLDSWSSVYIAPVRKLRSDYDRLSVNTAKLTERLAEANNRLAHSGFETV